MVAHSSCWMDRISKLLDQEKAFVTGLEAANRVVDHLDQGELAEIIPVDADEPHVQELRRINEAAKGLMSQLPFSQFFL